MTAPDDTRPAAPGISDRYGPLLYLSDQDRRGLEWLKLRAQVWRNAIRRRRKYGVSRGEPFTPEESELIGTLAALENAISRLLLAEPSSLCPVSKTRPEHTRQGDAQISRANHHTIPDRRPI